MPGGAAARPSLSHSAGAQESIRALPRGGTRVGSPASTVSISGTISQRKVPIDANCYAQQTFAAQRSIRDAYGVLMRDPAKYGGGWWVSL
jgi:hypothetical protein